MFQSIPAAVYRRISTTLTPDRQPAASARRRRVATGSVTAMVASLAVSLGGAPPAQAVGINEPPVLPHSIIVFPVRDFVSASGLTPGQRYVIEDWRAGVRVGVSDPITADTTGLAEVNHPGGGCWVGVTPDVRPQDRIVVHPEADAATGDATTTANVVVTQPATKVNATTVVMKGTATDAAGAPLPIAALESRIVANKQAFVINGRRTLRAPGDGTISYDAPGSAAWTATFTGLGGVSTVDGISDADRAVDPTKSESRGMWLGVNPGTTAEGTIYEFGQVGGPAAPCTAPLATGPSTPAMTPATDTGASSTDAITSNVTPSFASVLGNAAATSANLYVDGLLSGSTTAFGAGGSFTIAAATAIADGPHSVRVSEVAGGVETMSGSALAIVIDTAAPAAPAVTGTVPATTGGSTAPAVKGTAEAGSTVSVFADAACTPAALGTGTAAAFGSSGIAAPVAAGSSTTFFAQATDVAGNGSGCSTTSATYVQDSVPPPAPVIDPGSTSGLVASTSATFAFTDAEAGAGFECSLDGGAYAACASPRSYGALAQGAHSFAVRAVDPAGNPSAPASGSWTVDTVAPTTSITSPVGATINDPSPVFHFAASEAGSTFACSLDGSPAATCADGKTYGAILDGAHVFRVTATDPAGNAGATAAYSFTVDTAVPPVSIDGTPPNPTNTNTPTFTYSSSKPGVAFTCAFALSTTTSPSFSACPGGSFTSTARADGSYTFTVRATDAAGNVGTARTGLTIDTTAPAAPTLTSKPALNSTVTTPSFGFTSNEAGSSFLCSLTPGAAQAPCATGESYGPLAPGTYVFKVVAKDAAGNLGPATSYTFTVDTAAPIASISSGPTGLVNTRSPSFAFTAAGTGTTYQCALSPTLATFTACSSPKTYTAVADGSYTFQVRAIDAAGNVGPVASRSFTVDATAPTVTLTATPTNPTANATSTFSFTTETGAGTSCSLQLSTAARSFAACTSPATYGPLANGTYTFAVQATDAAGNTSTPVAYTYTVNTTNPAPTVTARTPAANATAVLQTVHPTATFSEAVTGVGPTTFTLRTGTLTGTGTAVTATSVVYNATTRVATFTPSAALRADTAYTATLTSGIKDSTGQPLATTSWSFLTGPRPTVTARTPAAGATLVSRTANVTATFSENVTGVGGTTFTLKNPAGTAVVTSVAYNATTRVATLNPGGTSTTFALAANTKYTATLTSGIKDVAGNPLATTTWSFTTGP